MGISPAPRVARQTAQCSQGRRETALAFVHKTPLRTHSKMLQKRRFWHEKMRRHQRGVVGTGACSNKNILPVAHISQQMNMLPTTRMGGLCSCVMTGMVAQQLPCVHKYWLALSLRHALAREPSAPTLPTNLTPQAPARSQAIHDFAEKSAQLSPDRRHSRHASYSPLRPCASGE